MKTFLVVDKGYYGTVMVYVDKESQMGQIQNILQKIGCRYKIEKINVLDKVRGDFTGTDLIKAYNESPLKARALF